MKDIPKAMVTMVVIQNLTELFPAVAAEVVLITTEEEMAAQAVVLVTITLTAHRQDKVQEQEAVTIHLTQWEVAVVLHIEVATNMVADTKAVAAVPVLLQILQEKLDTMQVAVELQHTNTVEEAEAASAVEVKDKVALLENIPVAEAVEQTVHPAKVILVVKAAKVS